MKNTLMNTRKEKPGFKITVNGSQSVMPEEVELVALILKLEEVLLRLIIKDKKLDFQILEVSLIRLFHSIKKKNLHENNGIIRS